MRAENGFDAPETPPPQARWSPADALAEAAAAPFRGVVQLEGSAIEVMLNVASRLSLHATFNGDVPPDETIFDGVQLQLPSGTVALSRCQLRLHAPLHGRTGRLVFLDDVYDCWSLLYEGKLVNVRGFFQNLPLVLAQKERVRPEFREYTANLLYDLSVYKKMFDDKDRQLQSEPKEVATAGQEVLLATEGRQFFAFFDQKLAELEALVRGFDKEEHERHGFYLRRLAWHFILASEFLKRTNLKPRGYAGDAEMMVMAYENAWVGQTVFNKLMHKHPLETAAAQAVRNRRGLVAERLRATRDRLGLPPRAAMRFMSVAAGPALELGDIFRDGRDSEQLRCALLDQDPAALVRARETVARVQRILGKKLTVDYVCESVRTMLRSPALTERLGTFHFIYSMGLFDYLTPPVAVAVLQKLYELLEPGGTLVVGNYHVGNPTRVYMAYWMDWVLYYRTEAEMLALAANLPGARPTLHFDPTRAQMFMQVDKT